MANWLIEDKKEKAFKGILFILNPLLSVFYSFKRINTRSSYVVFFLFALLFGLSFTVQSGKTEDLKIDGATYREKFDQYQTYSEVLFYNRLQEYLEFDEGDKDFYFDIIAFSVSKWTDNYHYLFLIFAAVFAYFALKSLRFLTAEPNFTTSISCLILVFLFMNNQIFNINGVRFWTAAWIAVYSIFQVFRNGNKHYVWLALFTPFIHGSFFIFFVILVFAFFLKKMNHKLWVILFLISLLASNFSIEIIRGVIDSLPSFLSRTAS